MTEEIHEKNLSRRGIVKAAAWSLPVVATAATVPLAAASVGNASVSWTASETDLLSLRVLDGGGFITAQALVTVPTEATIINGPGAISGTATVTITVGRPGGINIPVGRARGFGVASFNGVDSTAGERTAVYQNFGFGDVGFPATTFTRSTAVNVAANGSLEIPVEFGLAGTSTGVSVSLLASFPVSINVDFGAGNVYTSSTSISVPVGAGIL